MNRSLITIVLTDIEGSTRAWLNHPAAMGPLLERHDTLITENAVLNDGIDLGKRSEGDGRFLVFDSPQSALIAAIAAQRAIAYTRWAPVSSLQVRMAIHSGEAELRNGDYFGTMVNRCARMRGACHGGQIILSDSTRLLIGENLPEGIDLKDLGVHRFKDLHEPERIYQVVAPGLPDKFPPLKSLSPERNNLPVQLSSFIGREEQIERIHGALRKHRVVTLTGTGGGGKTRLSIQFGAECVDEYPEGVWFISLVGVENPQMVMQAIAEALPISLNERDPLTAIQQEYQEGKALLIVDNCEHLVEAASSAVVQIVRACPGVSVLATSRESLRIRGEGVYEVPPMASRLSSGTITQTSIRSLESVALLLDRTSSRRSGEDILTNSTAGAIAKICELLDGIPLALEQAAANLAYLSPEELLERLEQAIEIFERTEVDVEERHVSMESSIQVSFDMLSESEKLLFLRLSVFVGGWSIKSAEHVCGDEKLPTHSILRLLEKLINRSLVRSERATGVQNMRFRMLEPIRQFAARRRPTQDEDLLFARLFDWSKHLAQQAHETGLSAAEGRYLYLLNAEHDNIRSALRWSQGRSYLGSGPLELALYMHRYWLQKGLLKEGSFWLQHGLDIPDSSLELRADCLNALGILMWQRGEMAPAATALQESWKLWEQLRNEHKRAMVDSNLGGIAFDECDYEDATQKFRSAEHTFRSLGDHHRLATALENRGVAESVLGRLEEAEEHLAESVHLHKKIGHLDRIIKAQDSLCGVYLKQRRLLEKRRVVLEMLEMRLLLGESFASPLLDSNILEVGARLCWELLQGSLAAKSWGAMQKLVEESELVLPPNQRTDRAAFSSTLEEHLGHKNYHSCLRAGRAAGPYKMIEDVVEYISSNDQPAILTGPN